MVEQTIRAHQLNAEGEVVNTITVPSLDFLPGLVSAAEGGRIGDRWDGEQFIPQETTEDRGLLARTECERRIFSVVSRNAQMNLTSNRAAGRLSSEQMQVHDEGLDWIHQCQVTAATLALNGGDILDDDNWPAPTQAMIDLAKRF